MRLIDDEGRVVGLINVVDLCVLLVLGVIFVGGVVLVPIGPPETEQLTVVVETTERPYVGDALAEAAGAVGCDRGATVTHIQVRDSQPVTNSSVVRERLWITARVEATGADGGWTHGGQPVAVGSELRLDLCTVRVDGTVVDVQEGDDE